MESRINGYDVIEELNKGAFCDAYKVRKGGIDYFMKLYKDPTVMSADYEDFKKNQRAMIPLLKALGNKVETIIEDFEVDGRYYQVKEYIAGAMNLRKWLESNGNYDERLDVAIQFCEIMKAVHEKGIIHQDLKPEQVMTIRDSSRKAGIRLILTDFDWSIPNGRIVRLVGTPWYGNIDGNVVTFKSDIFTFGIILTELLTGCNPYYVSETGTEHIYEPTQWVKWVKDKDYTPPIKINDELPKAINDVIVRCLDPNPKTRPTLDEIYSALQGKAPAAARKKIKLRAATGDFMFMVPGMGYGRKHFKELFGRTADAEGNPIYKYLDKSYAALSLNQDGEDLLIFSPANQFAKNKLLLNGSELSATPTPIHSGDAISLHSDAKGCEIAKLCIEII